MRGVAGLRRWALVAVGAGAAALAFWLFLAPFRILISQDTFDVSSKPTYIADCSPAFRQLIAPPAQGRAVPGPLENGVSGAIQPNHDPLCRDTGRTRALSSLGFAGTAVLAFALTAGGRKSASTTTRDDQTKLP